MREPSAPPRRAPSQPRSSRAATVCETEDPARPSVAQSSKVVQRTDPLRTALLDSRQRWRDLVALAADIAFETDALGRLTFVTPAEALGWPADKLIGRTGDTLLARDSGGPDTGFDPFRATVPLRGQRAWLRRQDGGLVCMSFSVAPLFDSAGCVAGCRGVGQDITDRDRGEGAVAAALRRTDVVDHILWRMRQEVLAPRMMQVTLEALCGAIGTEGAAVLDCTCEAVAHRTGSGMPDLLHPALLLLRRGNSDGAQCLAPDGRRLLACPCQTRFGGRSGLVLWRSADGRPWDDDDIALIGSVTGLVRVILEHEAIQQEMARQARTDPLTGLLNRRAFIEELTRRIERLDREAVPGTLMFVDLDNFKRLNDARGHDAGDDALCIVANLLRAAVRPADLVARLGGDEFALWLDGADELVAAERAELLRVEGPCALAHLCEMHGPDLSMSIGIATRWPGRGEDIDTLMHRADQIMYEVKRAGRGHWRVARSDGW